MAKISYTATFDDGSIITRKSDREYRAAWRLTLPSNFNRDNYAGLQGFSSTLALAEKAARKNDWAAPEVTFQVTTNLTVDGVPQDEVPNI